MAFVIDPDDLDRWQVAVDPVRELIALKGLGAVLTTKRTDGATIVGATFTSAGADFSGDGVAADDILAVVSGEAVIGHYTVVSVDSATQLTVSPAFTAAESGLTFRVQEPVALDGPNGGNLGDGVTLQALYSFLKEEWRTLSDVDMPDLIKFIFPLESITREQFEIGGPTHGDWDFADLDTRNLIRTGGWKQITSGGLTEREYAGIITLGSLDTDAQVYYLQEDNGTPTDFVLTGAVNQAILVFEDGGDDFRGFLKLFVRKKARTYAQSEIADIGVTTIETIVNRFPLTHVFDPAILLDDGELAGDGANNQFQDTEVVDSAKTDGVTSALLPGGVFTLTSATSTFTSDPLIPGDTVRLTSGSDQGFFEIVSIDSATQLTLFAEPTVTFTGGESALAFTTRTGVRDSGAANATLADVDGDTGTLTSSGATFTTNDGLGDRIVLPGDMVQVTAGAAAVIGVYKVLSVDSATQLTLDTSDQVFAGQTNQTFRVLRPGMHLQFKSVLATPVTASGGRTLTFAAVNPDTITASSGNFVSDGFVHGMAITVVSPLNSGTYIVDTVAATVLTLIPGNFLVAEGPLSANASISGEVGFVRNLNQIDYPFNWRLFGNGGSLQDAYQFLQRELRRATDIDESNDTSRGDITDLLMSFASPTGTGINLFIDDLVGTDSNNATFRDLTNAARNFAFIAGVTINLNTNITGDSNAKVVVFFTDPAAGPGDEFGTNGALIVEDVDSLPMEAVTPLVSPLVYSFDYDNNAQGGRTPATAAAVTIVCIGEDRAQYVQTLGTIERANNNVFSLVAALERNYSNPV
jgi:hypothetical protein